MEKIHGIYKIINTLNNKTYIGSSKNIKVRWYKHKSLLKNNKHENNKLQNSVNKYGIDKFNFEIVEEIKNLNDFLKIRNEREQYWKDLLKSEYNIQEKVDYSEIQEETKLKISETLKRKYANNEIIKTNTKKLYQYSRFTGELVKIWDCVNDAIRAFNLTDFTTSKIHRCCWGETPSYSDFVWSYDEINFVYARTPKSKNTVVLVDQVNKTYEFFSSLNEAEEFMGFGKASLRSCKNKLYRKRYSYYFISAPVVNDLKPFELLGTRKVVNPKAESENLDVNGEEIQKKVNK